MYVQMPRRTRMCYRYHIRLYVLLLLSFAATCAGVVTIGFHSSFTNAANPFAVTECDAACTSPGSVTLLLKVVRSGTDLSSTDTVYVTTRPAQTPGVTTATANDDYTPLTNISVKFSPSETIHTVPVTIISDGVYEEDEQFEAYIDNPSAGVILGATTAYINIQDGGDAGIFSFSSSRFEFKENAGNVQVGITRKGGASRSITVKYRLSNPTQATAVKNKNFMLLDSVYEVQFAEYQRDGVINIQIINDDVYEANEFFYIEIAALSPTKLSDPTTSIAKFGSPRSTVVFIVDDGDAGQFDFASSFILCREDNGTAVVTIKRSKGTSSSSYIPVYLTVATVGSSGGSNATEGGSLAYDYLAKTEKLSWANGEVKKSFAVKIFNNNRYDSQTRSIKLRMTSVEGGASTGPQNEMWVYIIDDRDAGTLSFQLPHYEVAENGDSVTVDVIRTGVSDSTNINTYASGVVTVDVATYSGIIYPGKDRYDLAYDYGVIKERGCTHVSPCTAVEDVAYTPLQSTTLTFGAGETRKTVTISILNNDLYEAPSRSFKLILQNVTGGAHLGIDYEHPMEWYGYNTVFLALEKRKSELPDNVGTIVSIIDDGDPAVIVSKASVSISEIGQVDSFRIHLNSQPLSDVGIVLSVDSSVLQVTPSSLKFATFNWNTDQWVQVSPIPNNITTGIQRTDITITCSSSDAAYSSSLRVNVSDSGTVLAAKVYTQKWGEYYTGNLLHAFPWLEEEGVLTAPFDRSSITAFILDDDHASVSIYPEDIRHTSSRNGGSTPDNFVCVRKNGHNAFVRISLTSEPTTDVFLSFLPELLSEIAIEPASIDISSSEWDKMYSAIIYVSSSLDTNDTDEIHFSKISVYTRSSGDSYYNSADSPVGYINVMKFPPALALLNSSLLEIRENDASHPLASYDIRLGSQPNYWEPAGGNYVPVQIKLSADADTSLTSSSPSLTYFGSSPTLVVASNSSKSTEGNIVPSIGVIRFKIHPSIESNTGSIQVGLARLRVFRVSGGENGGLGGIKLGVTTAQGISSDNWDENLLHVDCSSANIADECSLINGTATYSSFFPDTSTFENISNFSDGEVLIDPSTEVNTETNAFAPSSGWLEIDVTTALNRVLAQLQNPSSKFCTITFLLYSKSIAAFTYDGVDEVILASKEYPDASLHPEILVTASGRVNLALSAVARQSHPGNAVAAIDGKQSSRIAVATTYAMSTVPYKYPWWQADLTKIRLIEDIIITIKRKALAASLDEAKLPVSLWVFLSQSSLATSNNGLTGFLNAKSNALFSKQFNVTTRSFDASDTDTIVLRWDVNGEEGYFGENEFIANYSVLVEARYLLIQVEEENNIILNEVEIYQQAFTSAHVSVGGFMPSSSVLSAGQNQIQLISPAFGDVYGTNCNDTTRICRRELLFTSGNWNKVQTIQVKVIDDDVAMGDREILLTHRLESLDADFSGSSLCDSTSSSSCNLNVFNESSIKPLLVREDDVNQVLLSKSRLEVVEGSNIFPNAPVIRREKTIRPNLFRCSSDPDNVIDIDRGESTACVNSFVASSATAWKPCISNIDALPLETGSTWVMAGFDDKKNLSSITLTVPSMSGANYIRRMSVWLNPSMSITESSADLLQLAANWVQIKAFEIAMESSGTQTLVVNGFTLFPVQTILIAFEESYDDDRHCIVAPRVVITAYEPVIFPISIRGDLRDPESISPNASRLSRMHLFGVSDTLQIQLSSEPIADTLISILSNEANANISVFDPTNNSAGLASLQVLTGAAYENGDIWTFCMPTVLTFTATNWNISQQFTFVVVDDNTFQGNRSFAITHISQSNDSEIAIIANQTFDGTSLSYSFTTMPTALSYSSAKFVVSDGREDIWPYRLRTTWVSDSGNVQVNAIDDDLPGVTLSASQIVVSESGPSGNYSVCLDSAPSKNVVIDITYERVDDLLTVDPLQLTFTCENWYEPQYVVIYPVANDVYDAGAPFTLSYSKNIAKAKQPLLKHHVTSDDAFYDSIPVGGNEHDQSMLYVTNQGVQAIVEDDDTGCVAEYACENGGECMSEDIGNVCKCPTTFGMKNCSATCVNSRDCMFDRLAFQLQCHIGQSNAICSSTFSAGLLVSTLYQLLTTAELAVDGKIYPKLSLASLADVMYVVNQTSAECVDGTGNCVVVRVDFLRSTEGDTSVVDKMIAYAKAGSLKTTPLYVELVVAEPQYPADMSVTIVVWVFVGVCGMCTIAGGIFFSARAIKVKRSQVIPRQEGDIRPTNTEQLAIQDAIVRTSPIST